MIVECADDGGNCIHQLEILSLHVGWKQALRVRGIFKKSGIELNSEISPKGLHFIE